MWRLAGRNAVAVGAALAALLLTMQLRTEGVRGYEPADVLSILLFAVPTALQHFRSPADRRSHRPHPPRDATPGAAGTASEPPEPSRPGASQRSGHPEPSQPSEPSRRRVTNERLQLIERLVVQGVVVTIAVGSYGLIIVLVLLQAWIPTLSALMVCGIALAGASHRTGDVPAPLRPPGAGSGGRHGG